MNTFKKIAKFIIPKERWKQWKHDYNMRKCEVFPVLYSPKDVYESVYHIKDDTWETMYTPAIYKISQTYSIQFYHEAQDILRIPQAKVFNNSDVVITEKGVVWDKAYRQDFSKISPQDRNVYVHSNKDISIKRCENCECIAGRCLSLLGVHADIWAHFLVQFLPKLYYAEDAGLFNEKLTILLPKYHDANVIEIINTILGKHNTITKIESADNVEYQCEELMYIPTASVIANHNYYTSPFDIVIPQIVYQKIHKYLVNPLLEKVKNKPTQYEKIYLPRNNADYRNTHNISHIDEYFRNKGFYFVEGSKLTLEEKADIFLHAKIIAGPYSSAWINTIFCGGAKGLVLSNIPKSQETYYLTLAGEKNIEFLHVIGQDDNNNPQTDFYMPIRRVDEAYKQLLGGKI